ncbi:hypothetical protein ACHAWF_004194 [Thalassiosira exigua]
MTEEFTSTKKILKNLLDDDMPSAYKPATYVNQWRYRSSNGRTYNCEFWYDAGKLDGDTLLDQFIQVVMRCEIVGSRVLGFVCDAGGKGGWLPSEAVRTANPYDPSRYIYLYHCSTHDLKATRNALFTSWTKKGKKRFLDENDIQIGKAVVDQCFQRDKQRLLRGAAPLSEVKETTVNLNKWSKMDASEAKRPFSWKTLCEISSHIYQLLGVSVKEQLRSKEENRGPGFMPAVAKHLRTVLSTQSEEKRKHLAAEVSSFEWLANVYQIFNATMLNTELFLSWRNIRG